MNNDKNSKEMVVLLQGNFCVITVNSEEQDKITKLVIDVVKKSFIDPLVYFAWGDFIVFGKYIIGWYFRDPVVSPADKMIDFIDKKLPNETESWKGEDGDDCESD